MNPVASLARNLFAGSCASFGLRAATKHVRATEWQLVALVVVPRLAAFVYDLAGSP